MKAQKILLSTLVAAAASAFSVSASAEEVTLTNGVVTTLGGSSDTGAGNTYSYSAPESGTNEQGGWIQWSDSGFTSDVALGTADSNTVLSGSGLIGLTLKAGDSYTVVSVDLTNTTASNFSGQLTVLNQWNNGVTVKLSGETWQNTEYVFAGRSRESSNTWLYVRGYGDTSKGYDTLSLTGGTTLAGVSGFDKSVTEYRNTSDLWSIGSGSAINAREAITAESSGTKLSLAGTGTYAFYGTVGTSSTAISIEKSGTGTQTFGGTNYFDTVTVSAGTLSLAGTTTISGAANVSGGALSLDGTVNLSSAISVDGNASVSVVKDTVVFNLVDSLKTTTDSGDGTSTDSATYTLISGASTVENWTDLTTSNFTLSGEGLSGRSTVDVTAVGQVVVSSVVADLVWGGDALGTWNTNTENKVWKNGDTTDSFYSGDNVTFASSGPSITVDSGVVAGTVTISNDTTLSGSSFTADSVTISGGTNTISSGFTADTFTVSGGTTTLNSSNSSYFTTTNGTTIESGAKLILGTKTNSTGLLRGSATVNGTLEFTDGDVTGYSGGTTSLSSITVNSGGVLNLAHTTNETFAGTLTLAGGSLTGNSGSIWDVFGSNSTINVTGADSKISGVDLRIRRENATITISSGASLTIAGKVYAATGSGMSGSDTLSVSANGTGALIFTGTEGSFGSGFYSQGGSLTVGDGTNASVLSVSRIEVGDQNGGTSNSAITVKDKSTLKITGSTNTITSDYKTASVVLGEWNVSTTANIEGTLLAQNAEVGFGDYGGSVTVSGTLAAKGFGQAKSGMASTGSVSLTLSDNGTLVLGESGLVKVKNSSTITLNAGTVGMFSDTTTISAPATLNSATGTTFDTQKYAFASDGNSIAKDSSDTTGGTMTISGVLSGTGKLIKTGVGSLVLSADNTFTGGITVSAGTLEAASTAALSTGAVSVESGATLKVSVQNVSAGSITLSDGAKLAISDSLLTETSADSLVLNLLSSESITLGSTLLTSENAETVDNYFDTSNLGDYATYLRTWGYENNLLSLTLTIPEPSAFGLLAGVGALALAVSRRRRSRK